MNEIVSLYSKRQQGGELPYFIGKQYGSGWFRNIVRLAFPFLKRFGKVAVDTAKDALSSDAEILPSFKRHALDAARETFPSVANIISDKLGIPKATKKSKRSINKRRKIRQTIFN